MGIKSETYHNYQYYRSKFMFFFFFFNNFVLSSNILISYNIEIA